MLFQQHMEELVPRRCRSLGGHATIDEAKQGVSSRDLGSAPGNSSGTQNRLGNKTWGSHGCWCHCERPGMFANYGFVLGYDGIILRRFFETQGGWVHRLSLQALEYKQSGNTTSSKPLRLLQRMLLWNWQGRLGNNRGVFCQCQKVLGLLCLFQKLAGQKECSNTGGCTLVSGRVDYQPRRVGMHPDFWQDDCPNRPCGIAPGRLFEPYVVSSLPLLLQVKDVSSIYMFDIIWCASLVFAFPRVQYKGLMDG